MIMTGLINQIKTRPEVLQPEPLRAYRLALLAARFNYPVERLPGGAIAAADFSKINRSQVLRQLSRFLLTSEKPSRGLLYLLQTGVLEKVHPLLFAQVGCKQEISHHPEGDVFQHTLLVVDQCRLRLHLSRHPQSLMLAALLHDVGKPVTTGYHKGKITSYGHDVKGSKLAAEFLREHQAPKVVTKAVRQLVREHMQPVLLFKQKDKISDNAIRRLGDRVDVNELLLLSEADYLGRGMERDYQPIKKWIEGRMARLKPGTYHG
jgi:tRNA nucleotidyltransferase (CCA-adding enzyme)